MGKKIMNIANRRDFIKLAAGASLAQLLSTSCGHLLSNQSVKKKCWDFKGLDFFPGDELNLASGFKYKVLLKTGDIISKKNELFGDCCDFIHFQEIGFDSGLLWVNHEYVVSNLLHGRSVSAKDKTKEMVDLERSMVGGSLVEIKRDNSGWGVHSRSEKSFRLDANSEIPLVGPVEGTAIGTFANCSGGFTPWGTILSCEENVENFYESDPNKGYGWSRYYSFDPKHYGWVVEIDPKTKRAKKLTSLGRFAHEVALFERSNKGHAVIYLSDDAEGECLYKFISKNKIDSGDNSKLLHEGELFVASLEQGKWLSLSPENNVLYNHKSGKFKTLENILLNTRQAAKVVGGTPLGRPEGLVSWNGMILVALTNYASTKDYHGKILSLKETGENKFLAKDFYVGGPGSGMSCPDNIATSPDGSLWVCMDISGKYIGKYPYKEFPRNAMVKLSLDESGSLKSKSLFLAPNEAEVTGPCFHPEGKDLFVSVQHPGELSWKKGNKLTSNWPLGGDSSPLSSVVCISKN
jgi:uncharacterized protein